MKKFVAILLALVLVFTCVACSSDMTSAEFKAEYEKFDWKGATETSAKAEADRLLAMLEDLPSATQSELSQIKLELEEFSKPKPTATPEPTDMPDATKEPVDPEDPDSKLQEQIDPDSEMQEPDISNGIDNMQKRVPIL